MKKQIKAHENKFKTNLEKRKRKKSVLFIFSIRIEEKLIWFIALRSNQIKLIKSNEQDNL